MSKIQPQSSKSAKSASLTDREREANAHALAAVRSELLAIPQGEVSAPVESAFVFAREVRDFVQTASPAQSAEEAAALDRVELMARALEHAQHEWAFEAPAQSPAPGGLAADAERVFDAVEELFAQQIRRGIIRRRLLPPRKGTSLYDRSRRIEQLVDTLEAHDRYEPRTLLHSARRIASFVPYTRPVAPAAISPTELRNRAYTALIRALGAHGAAEPERRANEGSGVFALGDHEVSLVHASR